MLCQRNESKQANAMNEDQDNDFELLYNCLPEMSDETFKNLESCIEKDGISLASPRIRHDATPSENKIEFRSIIH